jgi:hypothetical protein
VVLHGPALARGGGKGSICLSSSAITAQKELDPMG